MRLGPIKVLTSALLIASNLPAIAAGHRVKRAPVSSRAAKPAKPKAAVLTISPERATQIQGALIKAGYLNGAPSGAWDPETQAAMEKLQGDNGWQTKFVPDARAIIKLGLGPSANPSASDRPSASAIASR